MKTTIELSDALLQAAKDAASGQGTTLRNVFESALRAYLEQAAKQPPQAFVLRRRSFGGKGLRAEALEAGWERIRELSYEGRGV
jgi:hypothetical protein